jgi:hypothetical protein
MMLTLAATDSALALYAIGLVVLTCAAGVALLRYAQFPDSGRAILAGALAGFLIGPTILGRVVPQHHERMFSGGVKQREHRDYVRWFGENTPTALPNLTPEARVAERARSAQELAAAEEQLAAARWDHQRPMRIFVMSVVALAMIASAMRSVRSGDRRQGFITPASVGLWSLALPGAVAYAIAVRWWNVSVSEAMLLAAAVGIGPWALSAIDRRIADDAEFGGARMMQTAGRIASTLAIALVAWALWRARGRGPGHEWETLLLAAPLLALPIAWLLDLKAKPGSEQASKRTPNSVLLFLLEALLAILAALVAMKFDLYQHFTIWPLLVLALLADDGRWLGAFLGAVLVGGRPALRSMRLVMPAMAAGPTQLAIAALALHGWLLPERFALPLLAGAILIEVSTPARRRMAARLVETEAKIEQQTTEDD